MRKKLLIYCFAGLLLIAQKAMGQGSDFTVSISNNVYRPGDTLVLNAEYTLGKKQLPPSTLDLIIENEQGNTWNIRWPLIDGKSIGGIVFPEFLPKGKYHIWCAVQPRFFRIYGQVVYCSRKKIKTLEARVTAGMQVQGGQQITLEPDRSFLIKDWLLPEEATIVFSTGNPENVLHIHPECWLDSAYQPAAKAYAMVNVTDKDTVITEKALAPGERPLAWRGPGVYKNLSQAEVYNCFFSKGMFRSKEETLIDVMNDSITKKQADIARYIVEKLEEQKITTEYKNGKLWYNGEEVSIYINEQPYSSSLAGKVTDNIALIKFIPQTLAGNDGVLKNILAIYYKRYPFTDAGIAQNVFLIKGYNLNIVGIK